MTMTDLPITTAAPPPRPGGPSVWQRAVGLRLPGWLLIIALLATWQAGAMTGLIATASLPPPSTILASWWREVSRGTLLVELGSTLRLMFTGYFLAAAIGAVVGILMGRIRLAWSLLEPIAELVRPVPISAVVPILILLLGIDDALKITAVFWGSFFPILLNTFAGVRSLPRTMRETGQTFGLGEWQMTTEIVVMHALPSIFVGLRIALTISLIVAVFSEMLAGFAGIGYFIMQAQQTLSVDRLWAGVLTLSVVGYCLNLLFLRIEALVLPWHAGSARRQGSDFT